MTIATATQAGEMATIRFDQKTTLTPERNIAVSVVSRKEIS